MEIFTNSVVLGVASMLLLAAFRLNMVLALLCGTLIAGWSAGFSAEITLSHFNRGLAPGAVIALNYALLGAFASAISHCGVAEWLLEKIFARVERGSGPGFLRRARFTILGFFFAFALLCKNFIPMHIAFIPLLVPPLLGLMGRVRLDRRALAVVLTFGLVVSYMLIPVGFGHLFLEEILRSNLRLNGIDASFPTLLLLMALPAFAMFLGLLWAVFVSYSHPRSYAPVPERDRVLHPPHIRTLAVAVLALCAASAVQLLTHSIVIANGLGLLLLLVSRVLPWKKSDGVILEGFQTMAGIGMIMIAAAGFASLLRATGAVDTLVTSLFATVHGSRALAAALMLLLGLLITLGIGSCFATVPIVATLFIPFCQSLGFSPSATISLVAVSAILGDPGGPASNSTLGPSSGLSADGQFSHMRDSVWPTFLHFNIPLFAAGWLAAMLF
jgi:predicted histidine transporter YuiF (NhaC family)